MTESAFKLITSLLKLQCSFVKLVQVECSHHANAACFALLQLFACLPVSDTDSVARVLGRV